MRTPLGEKRLTISTITLRGSDDTAILHPVRETRDETPAVKPPANGPALTPRQREILCLIADGVRARQIAARLKLSEATVRNHIRAILLELGVHSQLEAVARARSLGLVRDEQVR
jgi:DNA-binding NarL/FixJ family response regulator